MKYFNLKFLMVFLTLATAAQPAIAQLNGTGYYRFRNAQNTSDYISIANDKFNYHTCISVACGGLTAAMGSAGQARAMACAGKYLSTDIHMVDDANIINPGSVIYAAKKNGSSTNYDYNLIGQGTSLLTLTTGLYDGTLDLYFYDNYITIKFSSGSGANTLYTASIVLKAQNNSMANLGTRYFVDNDGTFSISESSSATNAKWYIEPVEHFNVLPEVELNGKYYTTLKVPFAFTLSGCVEKAYAITAVSNGILSYEEITGTIPAGTPVLLQCSSPNATDCQLIPVGEPPVFTAPQQVNNTNAPVANETSSYTGTNLLGGTYYCNTDGIITFQTSSGTSSFTATHTTAASGKFVIGKDANGKLGFIAATGNVEGNVMPANKAWLTGSTTISTVGLFPSVATPTFSLEAGTYTGTQSVTISAEEGTTILYSTDGGQTWNEYRDAIEVAENMTITAKAIKAGLYNDSEVASAQYVIEIPQPELTVDPTALTINDLGGTFIVSAANMPNDGLGVFVAEGSPSNEFSFAATEDGTFVAGDNYFPLTDHAIENGHVMVNYTGRSLSAEGTIGFASGEVSTTATVNYRSDIYIVTDKGVTDQWNFNEGTQMGYEDGTYTATFTAPADNTYILFARKLGEGVNWNTRYVFGPSSDGDWEMPIQATQGGYLDLYDDDPIKLPIAGEYTITINANDNSFSITRTIETVATPTFTPEGGTYDAAQTVTISCGTNGATISYKIGETEEWTPYTEPIEVDESCTITAKAEKYGWNPSEATAEYVIEIPVTVLLGDVNEDGEITIRDVTDLIDYLLGSDPEPFNMLNADVSQDGNITIKDVTDLIDILLDM